MTLDNNNTLELVLNSLEAKDRVKIIFSNNANYSGKVKKVQHFLEQNKSAIVKSVSKEFVAKPFRKNLVEEITIYLC